MKIHFSPQTIEDKKKDMYRDKHKEVAGLDRLMEYQPTPLDNWLSNDNTNINKLYI